MSLRVGQIKELAVTFVSLISPSHAARSQASFLASFERITELQTHLFLKALWVLRLVLCTVRAPPLGGYVCRKSNGPKTQRKGRKQQRGGDHRSLYSPPDLLQASLSPAVGP